MDNDVLAIRELRQKISSSLPLSERIEVALLSNEIDRKDLMDLNRSYKGMEERLSSLEKTVAKMKKEMVNKKSFEKVEKRVSHLPRYNGTPSICAICYYNNKILTSYIRCCGKCKRYICFSCYNPINYICIEC